MDYGCPAWTPVLAPHKGKVVEAAYDASGYGNYVKIDDGEQGSVLAHLSKISVAVGADVSEGSVIGYSGNTGNSTGAHLHWGYYRNPRNRNNGFNGFIDQTDYLKMATPPTNVISEKEQAALNFIKEKSQPSDNPESLVRSWHGSALDLIGTRESLEHLRQDYNDLNNAFVTGKTAIKAWEDFFNDLWAKLNPTTEKNPQNALAEIESLLTKEDDCSDVKKALATEKQDHELLRNLVTQTLQISVNTNEAIRDAIVDLKNKPTPLPNMPSDNVLLALIKSILEKLGFK